MKFLSNRKNIMSDSYHLPPLKARICRIAGAVFLLIALLRLIFLTTWMIGPAPALYVDGSGFEWKSEPLTLLDEADRATLAASPSQARRFVAYTTRWQTRWMLAAIVQLQRIPFIVLIASVGIALLRFGGSGGDPLAQAVPWLRRASIAAILCALAVPFVDSLTATVLGPGLPDYEGDIYFTVLDFANVYSVLMLAIGAYAAIWAIEAGLKAQRDLADFV